MKRSNDGVVNCALFGVVDGRLFCLTIRRFRHKSQFDVTLSIHFESAEKC